MKEYTNSTPIFSESIQIVETTDPAHADNINAAPKQLLNNDLVLASILSPSLVTAAFFKVFTYIDEDQISMSSEDIQIAIETEWDGSSSADPTALNSKEVQTAIETKWDGNSSQDPIALNREEIKDAIGQA